jgi:regulator of sirC expression with transglutaminase-like and TPR domain
MRVMVVATVLLSFAVPAVAQTRLPRTSPTERQVKAINRSLLREQRQLRSDEQYQIDQNQLRQSLDRRFNLSNPSPPARFRTCPAGSIGC